MKRAEGAKSATGVASGAVLAGILAVVIWGATPAATKYAVGEIDPFAVGMVRTALAGLVVLPTLLLFRWPLPSDRRGWRLLTVSATSGFIGFPLLFSLALAHTSTAHAALVLALAPVVTGLIGAAVERRLPGPGWWVGGLVALAGGAALILLRAQGDDMTTLRGDLLAFAACIAVAGGYVAGSRLSPSLGTWGVTAWSAFLGSLVALPVLAVFFGVDGIPHAGARAWTATAWLAVCSSLLAYVAWYWALAVGGVVRISTLQFLQPMVTLGLATVLFYEPMTPALLLSGAAILIGVGMARRG